MIYLAMYKAKGNWVDTVIRLFTGKPYSHCEMVIREPDGYHWYTSSPRDGGVRVKRMNADPAKWDLIPLPAASGQKIRQFFKQTKGKKYDFLGAIGVVLPLREKPNRYYCSEWCYQAIYGEKPKKGISPNALAKLVKRNSKSAV